jgi:hypothetical protein
MREEKQVIHGYTCIILSYYIGRKASMIPFWALLEIGYAATCAHALEYIIQDTMLYRETKRPNANASCART